MKQRIAALLCTAALAVGAAAPQALAVERHYPTSVETYLEGDSPRIRKVYQLSLADDPAGIPTGEFERDGLVYRLLDLTRKDEVGVDTRAHTETVTLDSATGELSEVLKLLDGQREAATEDGYAGTLILDHTSIQIQVKGYASKTRNLSAARSYPNLSGADLSLVPKTITDSGKTLTLADVQWSSDGEHYTAAATYTGTATSRYATGYTVTANYTGQVAKPGCDVVTYTAVFGGTEPEAEAAPVPEQTPAPTPTPEPTPEPEPSPTADTAVEHSGPVDPLPLLVLTGIDAVFLGAVLWLARKARGKEASA